MTGDLNDPIKNPVKIEIICTNKNKKKRNYIVVKTLNKKYNFEIRYDHKSRLDNIMLDNNSANITIKKNIQLC